MLKNILKIFVILSVCICTGSVYGKNYGSVNKMVVTAETIEQGSVVMSYNLDIVLSDELKERIDTFEIPMLSENFICTYYTRLIKSVDKVEDKVIIKTMDTYGASDRLTLVFQVRYQNFYRLSSKNEAIYKFRFDKIKGFSVKESKLRWKIENNVYANYTEKDDTYKYWNLKSLGMLSKEVVVKYDANLYNFPKSNSKSGSIRDYLLGGGAFFFIFLAVLVTNVISNDSYKKNSGFGFNTKITSL